MSVLDDIIKAAAEIEDGETGIDRCIEIYCEENGLNESVADAAKELAFRQGARSAGIPMSVIEGKTKLTDHFSQEYIENQWGGRKGQDYE